MIAMSGLVPVTCTKLCNPAIKAALNPSTIVSCKSSTPSLPPHETRPSFGPSFFVPFARAGFFHRRGDCAESSRGATGLCEVWAGGDGLRLVCTGQVPTCQFLLNSMCQCSFLSLVTFPYVELGVGQGGWQSRRPLDEAACFRRCLLG